MITDIVCMLIIGWLWGSQFVSQGVDHRWILNMFWKKQNDFCKSGNQAGSREELDEPIHQEFWMGCIAAASVASAWEYELEDLQSSVQVVWLWSWRSWIIVLNSLNKNPGFDPRGHQLGLGTRNKQRDRMSQNEITCKIMRTNTNANNMQQLQEHASNKRNKQNFNGLETTAQTYEHMDTTHNMCTANK